MLTDFLLSAAVLTPIIGTLGDQYGKKRLLIVSLGLFLTGSIAAACAPGIGLLVVCRVVSGAGGAIFPLSFGIIRDEFPPDKVKVGIGLLSAVFGIGGGIGIIASGLIVDHLSWRWLFAIGALPVAVVLVIVRRYVPESPVRSRTRPDLMGAALLLSALRSLLLGLTNGTAWGWTSPRIISLGVGTLVFGIGFIHWELISDHPMISVRLMAQRTVAIPNMAAAITGFAMFGIFVLTPEFVEAPLNSGVHARLVTYGFGASGTVAGLYILPSSVAAQFAGPISGIVGRRWGSKWPLSCGLFLISLGATILAERHGAPVDIMLAMVLVGVGVGSAFASMAALVAEAVPLTETAVAPLR